MNELHEQRNLIAASATARLQKHATHPGRECATAAKELSCGQTSNKS